METLFDLLTLFGPPLLWSACMIVSVDLAARRLGLEEPAQTSLSRSFGLATGFIAFIAGTGTAATHDPRIVVMIPAQDGAIARDLDIPWTYFLGFHQLGYALLGGLVATAMVAVVAATVLLAKKKFNI